MFYARMYKNTFTNTFQTMTSVDKSKGIVKSAKKNLNWSKKNLKKKFLAQKLVFNVDYENISDFVFTRIFFRNVKKIQSVKKNFEKKIFSTELNFQCRLRKYKRLCVYTNFFFNY